MLSFQFESINWNAVAALAAAITALAALITVIVYARIARIMWLDLSGRQRPYVFVESLNARISGTNVPKDKEERVRPADVASALDLRMENWIYLRNVGPVPARLKPLEVRYFIDGEEIDTGETTTKFAALFPGQQGHNIAVIKSGLGQVLTRQKHLRLKIRIEYDHIGAKKNNRFFSDITLRYVVNEDNLWACSWDYDEADGN
jgi:hypothetical protein